MATPHHISLFVCGHCAIEFTGRKRKFCTTKCQQSAADQRKVGRGIKGQSVKSRRPPNPIIDGYRVCLDCANDLPISEFPEYRHAKSGHRGQCKPCFAAFNRRRKKTHRPTAPRNYQMERIRCATNQGECGPPTRQEVEAMLAKLGPVARLHPTEAQIDRVAEQNARQVFQYLVKTHATDEWCERYYAALGKPWNNPRLSEAERYRLKYRGDPLFATKERVRRQITKAMNRDGISSLMRQAIKRKGRSRRVEQLIGYTVEDLCAHLEKQFSRGMTWDRFRGGEIHIDHITPQAAFDLADDSQWNACWCLSNLRPCWAEENLRKRDKIVFLV